MRSLFFCALLLILCGCPSPNKIGLDAINSHWTALRPYTVSGIDGTAELSDDAKEELKNECHMLSRVIEEELKNAE